MEKDYRLFVKNLPLNIDEAKIETLFGKYVTINNIDLKEKKDINDKINKFAFISVKATDKKLYTCFGKLNNERIDGFQISVELAKENFLERLKRERSENKSKQDTPKINQVFIKPEPLNTCSTKSKSKHKTFSDLDFVSNDVEVEEPKKKRKASEEYKVVEAAAVEVDSDDSTFTPNDLKKSNKSIKSVKQKYSDENYSQESESDKVAANIKFNNKNQYNTLNKLNNNVPIKSKNFEEPVVISESERKRLMALNQKKQAFKSQEQTIRNALKLFDSNKSNNKIVFDVNIDIESPNGKTILTTKKKNALFDSEDEDDNKFEWNEEELDAKSNVKKKLLKLQTNIGNDKRFVLDERFLDDEDKATEKTVKNSDDIEIVDEKKWQLDILGNVLGKPVIAPTADSGDIKKKNRMIRYDPTASNHQDYEITVEKPKLEKQSKKKRKSSIIEVKEEVPIPVSKEVFYDVSEKLMDSLKQNEGFSLLKTFGREAPNVEESNTQTEETENNGNFQFKFNSKNPFKYDSTDDEDGGNEETNEKSSSTVKVTAWHHKDSKLFFTHNDSRFQEAEQFFKNQSVCEEDAFKNRRRELKEIVRSKVRNNLRKSIPWNRKKVRKMHKQQVAK